MQASRLDQAQQQAEAALQAAQEEVRQLKGVLQATAAQERGGSGPETQAARAKLKQLEEENCALAGRLAVLQDRLNPAAAAAGGDAGSGSRSRVGVAEGAAPDPELLRKATANLAELQADHERLLDLLATYDAERLQVGPPGSPVGAGMS